MRVIGFCLSYAPKESEFVRDEVKLDRRPENTCIKNNESITPDTGNEYSSYFPSREFFFFFFL